MRENESIHHTVLEGGSEGGWTRKISEGRWWSGWLQEVSDCLPNEGAVGYFWTRRDWGKG
jgi:hypothetical protein